MFSPTWLARSFESADFGGHWWRAACVLMVRSVRVSIPVSLLTLFRAFCASWVCSPQSGCHGVACSHFSIMVMDKLPALTSQVWRRARCPGTVGWCSVSVPTRNPGGSGVMIDAGDPAGHSDGWQSISAMLRAWSWSRTGRRHRRRLLSNAAGNWLTWPRTGWTCKWRSSCDRAGRADAIENMCSRYARCRGARFFIGIRSHAEAAIHLGRYSKVCRKGRHRGGLPRGDGLDLESARPDVAACAATRLRPVDNLQSGRVG